jgi:hypothetical protein
MDARRASTEGQDTVETSAIRDALTDAHKEWSVAVEEVSGQTLIEAEREQFHPNGSTATALALDHPKKPGWEVLAPGNQDVRWEAMYDTAVEAADALVEIIHIFEGRRAVNHERPEKSIAKPYYALEEELLDSLKRHGASETPERAGERLVEVLHDG